MVCAPTSHISNVIIFSPEFKRIFTISNIHSARKRLHFNLSALAKIWLDVLLSPLFLVSISDNSASWRFVGTGSSLRRRLAESPASASALPHFALSCLALSCALAMVVFSLAGGIPDICHNHHKCWLCKKTVEILRLKLRLCTKRTNIRYGQRSQGHRPPSQQTATHVQKRPLRKKLRNFLFCHSDHLINSVYLKVRRKMLELKQIYFDFVRYHTYG